MAKVSEKRWQILRSEYEVKGTSPYALSKEYNIPRTTIIDRINREGWIRGSLKDEVLREAERKAFEPDTERGETHSSDSQTDTKTDKFNRVSDGTVENYSSELAKVLKSHRQFWPGIKKTLYESVKESSLAKAKLATEQAKAMSIIQNAERESWGIEDVSHINLNGCVQYEHHVQTDEMQTLKELMADPEAAVALETIAEKLNEGTRGNFT